MDVNLNSVQENGKLRSALSNLREEYTKSLELSSSLGNKFNTLMEEKLKSCKVVNDLYEQNELSVRD